MSLNMLNIFANLREYFITDKKTLKLGNQKDWYDRFMSTQQNTLYISCVIMLAAEIMFGGTCRSRVETWSRESMTYRVRDSKVRNGNSSTCLQHVWPLSKEVGKRTGNNRHGRKFARVVRIEALACRQARYHAQKIGAASDNVNHGHLLPRLTYESGLLDHVVSFSAALSA